MSQGESNTSSSGAERMSPDSMATELAGEMMYDLSIALYTRYEQLGNVQDLENVILCDRYAIRRLRPPGHPDRSTFLINLAAALRKRYERFGMSKDLEGAISLLRDAFRLCPPGNLHHSITLHNLAHTLKIRYDKLGDVNDLEDSISLQYDTLGLLPPGHPHRASSLNNLAEALRSRFVKLGNADDLKESISLHHGALSLRPPGHPDRFSSVHNLATTLNTRYHKFGNAEDLEESILLHRDALSLLPPNCPDRSNLLNGLADALRTRYDDRGNTDDLEDSISLHRHALSLFPRGHPDRSASLNNLANSLLTRYDKLGHAVDLEDCILLYRDALILFSPGNPNRSTLLNNLATTLRTRYDKLGNVDDLEHCISLNREALILLPPGHHHRSISLNNLAVALSSRYDKLGNANDLEESITLHRNVLGLYPPGHPNRSASLYNLANSLITRYGKMGNVNDLEDWVLLHDDLFSLLPPSHPRRSSLLNNFANALRIRYDKSGNTDDLERCISLHRDALSLRPPGHPDRSMSLCHLGNSLITRHVQRRKPEDFQQAFQCFVQAAEDSTSYTHNRLQAAIRWVDLARSYNHPTISPAYSTLLQLVNRSLIFRPNIESQQRFLASANIPQSVASDAASAAIDAGKVELAVEFLEQGRAILWSRVDAYKHPLNGLRQVAGGDELADRLQVVSIKLERLSLVSSLAASNQDSSTKEVMVDNQMKEHRVYSEEWEELVGRVREIEGFRHFLRADPFQILQSAAAEGPVILVNISQYRSDAIILFKETAPHLVNLPEVMLSELRDHKCGSAREISSTLAYLWDTIVSPIVDQLESMGVPKGSRIWWCPTAELCALPLHAAGRGKNNLQNIYISSYTSTLSSLIRARSDRQPPAIPKLLVVGQPSTDLKRVQDEVDIIQKLNPGSNILFGPEEATREAVLESLKDHSWVHFACHGLLGDQDQPFHASFKLHEDSDRRLLLLDLIRARLPNAELAFLSACHSAAGGLSTPDENIHLSAALQFCGFKSVVGTLWEMDDEDGPTISEKFYKYMFRDTDKIDFRDSAFALNSAIKEMRKAKVPMHRLAMFVHIGA